MIKVYVSHNTWANFKRSLHVPESFDPFSDINLYCKLLQDELDKYKAIQHFEYKTYKKYLVFEDDVLATVFMLKYS